MQNLRKIPVTVITGFLGAGKTSLIRHLLENANGKRLALIINEFGDLGIDADIIKSCGIESCSEEDVLELANGCICCTVADDFIPALESLLDRDDKPDHIVIETSGLALPKPLVKAFQWPEVRSRTTVDGVVAVVDGPAVMAGLFASDPDAVQSQRAEDEQLDHDSPLEEVFEDQLASADLVVVSKSDLMDDRAQVRVIEIVGNKTRPAVKALVASHGKLDPALILGLGAAAEEDVDNRWSHHDAEGEHDHDDFETFVVDLPACADPAHINEAVENTLGLEGVLRIKGIAHISGKPARLVVQGVGPRVDSYYDRPWADGETRQSRLVVIGLTGLDKAAIETALRRNNI
ncbi:MAG: cobalamin biosynthesis protein CobW [Rhodospirillales bacterium]|nr:cobalamin biosynthesis protein CobW [Rhodospirillales bacterium]